MGTARASECGSGSCPVGGWVGRLGDWLDRYVPPIACGGAGLTLPAWTWSVSNLLEG